MKIHLGGCPVLLVCVLLLFVSNNAQSKQKDLPCNEKPKKLLRDSRRTPLWFSSKQMMEKVIECVPTQFPPLGKGLKVEGIVIAEVLVNSEGAVQCVRAIKGHPLLKSGVVNAVRHWKFKPVVVKGEPLSFLGRLRFVLSSSGRDKDVPPCLRFVSAKRD
jgi:outer membrane biosynthesis protein TonB